MDDQGWIGRRVRGELAVKLGEQRDVIGEPQLRTHRRQRGVVRRRRAVDEEALPGSDRNTGISQGYFTQARAQAAPPRSASTASAETGKARSKRPPRSGYRSHRASRR